MKKLFDNDIVYSRVPYQKALPFLIKLGIDRVPVVIKPERNKIEVVVGTECGEKLLIKDKEKNETKSFSEGLPFFPEGTQGKQACTIGKPCR